MVKSMAIYLIIESETKNLYSEQKKKKKPKIYRYGQIYN